MEIVRRRIESKQDKTGIRQNLSEFITDEAKKEDVVDAKER